MEGNRAALFPQPEAPCNLTQTPIVFVLVTVHNLTPWGAAAHPRSQSLRTQFHRLSPPKFRLAVSRWLPGAGAAGRVAVQREERQALPAASSPGHSEAAPAGHITEGSTTSLSWAARSAPQQAADTHKVTEPRCMLLLCS